MHEFISQIPNPINYDHTQTVNSKTEGVNALLASTLAISPSTFALNTTIGTSLNTGAGINPNFGQSFINDPLGGNSVINLDTWTFAFFNAENQTLALSKTLTIYSGIGNISGNEVGTSISAVISNFGGLNSVRWTFAGGLPIVTNTPYSAVIAPSLIYILSPNVYPNGTRLNGINPIDLDLAFQGTFSSATPVPFEFSPALGLGVLGGLFVLKKLVKKKKSS